MKWQIFMNIRDRNYAFILLSVVLLPIIVTSFPKLANAQVCKVYPVDEAVQDSTLLEFRTLFINAIENKDTTFLFSILAHDILNSFGGDGGIDEFKQKWFSGHTIYNFWPTMMKVIKMGGRFYTRFGEVGFYAPYYINSPDCQYDGFSHGVIIDSNVAVHEKPASNSPTLTYLSYDAIQTFGWSGIADIDTTLQIYWVKVKLKDGNYGFVQSEFIRNPIGYRAGFIKRNGQWFLKAFVAGD